jgi:hypothetical protein
MSSLIFVDREKKLRFQQCPIIGIPLSGAESGERPLAVSFGLQRSASMESRNCCSSKLKLNSEFSPGST